MSNASVTCSSAGFPAAGKMLALEDKLLMKFANQVR